MHKTNNPWKLSLWIALGLIFAWLSLPIYAEESSTPMATAESATSGTTEEITSESPVETAEQPATTTVPMEAPAKTPPKSKHVTRALLTSGIENREPMDEIVSIDKNQERIYFFTEFTGLKGKIIKHRWEYKGKSMGEVNFNVGSNQWRCYSSKNLLPEWTGIWTVSIIDENNDVLAETYFEVTE